MIVGAGSGIGFRIPVGLLAIFAFGCGGGLRDAVYEGTAAVERPDPEGIARTLAKVRITVRGSGFEAVLGGLPYRGRVEGRTLVATDSLNRPIAPPRTLGTIEETKEGPAWRPVEGPVVPLSAQPITRR